MSPSLSNEIESECGMLLENYNDILNDDLYDKIVHNREWIDNVDTQKKITKNIFKVLYVLYLLYLLCLLINLISF